MAKHLFRISVEHISDPKGTPGTEPPMVFQTESHDNILEMAEKFGFTDDKQRSFLVGLKLFGEALLSDRDNPLYQDLLPHFGAFMKKLKSQR